MCHAIAAILSAISCALGDPHRAARRSDGAAAQSNRCFCYRATWPCRSSEIAGKIFGLPRYGSRERPRNRKIPQAIFCRAAIHEILLNDLVGAGEEELQHVEAERLGGLTIHDQLELARSLNG